VSAETVGRREQRRAQTREEILAAARELVAEHGAAGLSLKDVAEKARFGNPASLYRYFPSRRDILIALAGESLAALGDHLRAVPEELPTDERLVELGLAYLDFARDHPEELALLFETLQTLEPEEQVEALPVEVFGVIDGAVRRAVDEGVIEAPSDEQIEVVWHGAWALAHGLAVIERIHHGEHAELLRRNHAALLRAYIDSFRPGRPGLHVDDLDSPGDAEQPT